MPYPVFTDSFLLNKDIAKAKPPSYLVRQCSSNDAHYFYLLLFIFIYYYLLFYYFYLNLLFANPSELEKYSSTLPGRGGGWWHPLTAFRDCAECVGARELKFGIADPLFRPHLLPLSHFLVRSSHWPDTSYVNLCTAQKCRDFAALSRPRSLPEEDQSFRKY